MMNFTEFACKYDVKIERICESNPDKLHVKFIGNGREYEVNMILGKATSEYPELTPMDKIEYAICIDAAIELGFHISVLDFTLAQYEGQGTGYIIEMPEITMEDEGE